MNHVFYKKDFYQYLNTENMSQISAISLMDWKRWENQTIWE